jgi:hypothetical protein
LIEFPDKKTHEQKKVWKCQHCKKWFWPPKGVSGAGATGAQLPSPQNKTKGDEAGAVTAPPFGNEAILLTYLLCVEGFDYLLLTPSSTV